jgi:hypothetical protein
VRRKEDEKKGKEGRETNIQKEGISWLLSSDEEYFPQAKPIFAIM